MEVRRIGSVWGRALRTIKYWNTVQTYNCVVNTITDDGLLVPVGGTVTPNCALFNCRWLPCTYCSRGTAETQIVLARLEHWKVVLS